MKKRILSLVLVLAMALSFTACSALDGAMKNNAAGGHYGDASYAPSMGDTDSLGGESYTEIIENTFVSAVEKPSSYFSIDANTASYPNLRSIITNGYNVPKNAVRVEEMLNYFSYDYETPTDGSVLSLTSSVFDTPYNPETKLLTIGLAAEEVSFSEVRNNLVFLIDVSGSMRSADKQQFMASSETGVWAHCNPTAPEAIAEELRAAVAKFMASGK